MVAELLFRMRGKTGLFVGEKLSQDPVVMDGLYLGHMPHWATAFSDILLTSDRQFIGIVLYAGNRHLSAARAFAESFDSPRVRFVSLEKSKLSSSNNSCAVQIRWSMQEPEFVEVAQLLDDWYYGSPTQTDSSLPSAYGYTGLG